MMYSMENVNSICIPRVFDNIGQDRIQEVFNKLNIFVTDRIDVVQRQNEKGEKFKRVFVHIKEWLLHSDAQKARERLLAGKELKIVYDDPWFWKVAINKWTEKPKTPAPLPKPKIRIDYEEEKEPRQDKQKQDRPRQDKQQRPHHEKERNKSEVKGEKMRRIDLSKCFPIKETVSVEDVTQLFNTTLTVTSPDVEDDVKVKEDKVKVELEVEVKKDIIVEVVEDNVKMEVEVKVEKDVVDKNIVEELVKDVVEEMMENQEDTISIVIKKPRARKTHEEKELDKKTNDLLAKLCS